MLEIASKSQLRWAFLRAAAIFVPVLLTLGGMMSQFGKSARDGGWYQALLKPGVTPSPGVFPIAWTLLYIMMGFAITMVWHARGNSHRKLGFILFGIQIVLNYLWSPVFFGTRTPLYGLIIIVALVFAMTATAFVFFRIRKMAGLLMLPCLVWVLFATYLNAQIWRLNPLANTMTVVPAVPGGNPGEAPQSPGMIPL